MAIIALVFNTQEGNVMATRQFVGMLALATILSAGSAVAAEETLKFRLVVTGDPAATAVSRNITSRPIDT